MQAVQLGYSNTIFQIGHTRVRFLVVQPSVLRVMVMVRRSAWMAILWSSAHLFRATVQMVSNSYPVLVLPMCSRLFWVLGISNAKSQLLHAKPMKLSVLMLP
ncbi:hypothetical protein D3C87_835240 [compost metagenome]